MSRCSAGPAISPWATSRPLLSPFRYLALRADPTAWRLVDPAVQELLITDRMRGGSLIATIRAFADADLNLKVAANRLQIHHNTAQYRLHRIHERTGRNPRRIADLIELLVADGQHVEEGTPIYVIATEKVEQEIEAGASGTVQWTGEVGTTYDIGVEIGVIKT